MPASELDTDKHAMTDTTPSHSRRPEADPVELSDGQAESVTPPITGREILAILVSTVAAHLLWVRFPGYLSAGVLIILLGDLIWLGSPVRERSASVLVIAILTACVAGRLVWFGSPGLIVGGCVLLVLMALATRGRSPDLLDSILFSPSLFAYGVPRLGGVFEWLGRWDWKLPRGLFASVVLPSIAVVIFGAIFVQANPDVADRLGDWLTSVVDWIDWGNVLPTPRAVGIWLLVAVLMAGALCPFMFRTLLGPFEREGRSEDAPLTDNRGSTVDWVYVSARNSLIALCFLFTAYLAFEFQTLWRRDFPQGFYYAGYAHQGAAWLTCALALATVCISALFRGRLLAHPQVSRLRGLTWIWSGLNVLLALAVYNRLAIYVDFNGMTRMRTVGFLGVSCVLVGFLLVVAKVARSRGAVWLIRRQLWTLGFFVLLYITLPVDAIVHRYNAAAVAAGDLAPSTQIANHEINALGIIELEPLLDHEDAIIREGVRALFGAAARTYFKQSRVPWHRRQFALERLHDVLLRHEQKWRSYYRSEWQRVQAVWQFQEYSYQWW